MQKAGSDSSAVSVALPDEVIKKELSDIDSLVRAFHSNVLEVKTGIYPKNVYACDLEQSKHFFKQVWGNCLESAGQSLDKIGQSIKDLDVFLENFHSGKEIHDFNNFLQKLRLYKGDRNTSMVNSTEPEKVVETIELLTKFTSVGFKSATLIIRFLCLDSTFFKIEIKTLIPPLDRVNYRMCEQIFGKEFTKKTIGKENKPSFSKLETMNFDKLGKVILGNNKVLIDNLWFIGHFYHDCSNRIGCEGAKDKGCDCKIREGARIINSQYLKNIKLPSECPFFKYNCNRVKCILPKERKTKKN